MLTKTDPYEATATVSVSMRLNLGNYQHADVFASLNQVPFSATQEEIEEAVDTVVATVANTLVKSLKKKMRDLRDKALANDGDVAA